MAVYLDDWRQPARLGTVDDRWSHLVADDEEELHAFAARMGMRRAWYQHKESRPHQGHYDVPERARSRALALGAQAGELARHRAHAAPAPDGRRAARAARSAAGSGGRAGFRSHPVTLPKAPGTTALDPSTPVLVGLGLGGVGAEPAELMAAATEAALADAGGRRLVDEVACISVPQGSWSYPDPARLVAERLGATVGPHGAHRARHPPATADQRRAVRHRCRRRGAVRGDRR